MRKLIPLLLGLGIHCSVAIVAAADSSGSGERSSWQQSASALRDRLVDTALGLVGVPYRFGGNLAQSGLDCSGFVRHVWSQLGLHMEPRTAREMAKLGSAIDTVSLRAGDLVFFNTLGRAFSHVGVYIGEGKFVHASSGRGVTVSRMDERYYVERFEGARRLLTE